MTLSSKQHCYNNERPQQLQRCPSESPYHRHDWRPLYPRHPCWQPRLHALVVSPRYSPRSSFKPRNPCEPCTAGNQVPGLSLKSILWKISLVFLSILQVAQGFPVQQQHLHAITQITPTPSSPLLKSELIVTLSFRDVASNRINKVQRLERLSFWSGAASTRLYGALGSQTRNECQDESRNDSSQGQNEIVGKGSGAVENRSQPIQFTEADDSKRRIVSSQSPPKTKPPQPSPTAISDLTKMMRMMGTSPRRIFLSLSSATTIALAGNLFGVTSNFLNTLPEEVVEQSGLDSFYPRGDYKRVSVLSSTNDISSLGTKSKCKCTFLIPKDWVADTGLALAQARRQAKTLDYSMSSSSAGGGGGVLPDAAYGPPGKLDSQGLSNGDTNVSVIINNGVKNFSLKETLGSDPTDAAETLLLNKFGRKSTISLVSAVEDRRGRTDGAAERSVPVYQFEYVVNRGESRKPLRAISVVAGSSAGNAFVTLTVVAPDVEWEKPLVNDRLRRVAESFKLVE